MIRALLSASNLLEVDLGNLTLLLDALYEELGTGEGLLLVIFFHYYLLLNQLLISLAFESKFSF